MFAVPLEKNFFYTFFKVFFDNLESGKRIIVLEKSLEKVLNFGSKNLYEPWAFKPPLLNSDNIYWLDSLFSDSVF